MAQTDGSPTVADRSNERLDRRVLLTVLSCVVVFTASMTIVSASLPTMADDLDSSESLLSWAVTGLFLVMSVSTPVMGRLGDGYGHRRVFLAGTVVLAVGTLACAVAPTAILFVAARMVVGLGISATMPNGIAIIMEAHPVALRGEAMGWFQMAMTGAPVLGLVVGGPLIEAFGWRSVFGVLFPMSLVGFALAIKVIPDDRDSRTPVPIDVRGALTLATATLGFLLWLQFGGSDGLLTPMPLALLAIGAVSLVAFVMIEQRVEFPLLRLDYFSRRNFTGPLINHPLSQFAYMGSFLISPIMLDEAFGYSVAAVALILLFRPAAFSITSPAGGKLASRVGERPMLIVGTALMVASMLTWVFAALWVDLWLVILGLVLSGLAMGLSSPSYQTAVANAVEPSDLGIANGMGSTLMNIGMLTGIQVMFTVLGDGREPADFARTFAVGALAAAIGVTGALVMDRRR
ncbi:putative MFS family arabinose efflux permease [Ilumatobacter fluminis]|uniref:Putative MFS family arabinose efflux permease n=1 Tax=Ilumatobacter fluminis TaxID=467091 RepID=A0A4R7I3Y2_9ACTN|nr:MFS transporter [Ilumatobacter fluminis]TDT18311.1 putative MFS family arabinose efflux permease [Ilumatobacter fluminis]